MNESTPERWLPVVGWEGLYEVSDLGRVRSLPRKHTRGRIRKLQIGKNGYWSVALSLNEIRKTYTLHRLMAEAFLGPRPEGQEVRHLDDNRLNCNLSNLAYGTRTENNLDRVRNGIHPNTVKTHCPYGHEYTPENTYRSPKYPERRWCKACLLRRNRATRARRRAERDTAAVAA